MQESETEISFSLKNRNSNAPNTPIGQLLLMSEIFILCLGIGIFCWVLPSTFLAFPNAGPNASLGFLFYPLGLLLNFVTLILLITLPMYIRGLRTGPQQLRISHEGILYSYILPLSIRWDEIITLIPSTSGIPGLYIVVKDEMAIVTRFLDLHAIQGWERIYYRVMTRIGIWFSRSVFHTPSSLAFTEQVLPITIGNLVAIIQEHFASELREYHISIEKSSAKDDVSTNWRAGSPSF
jgi:hypothetical protein